MQLSTIDALTLQFARKGGTEMRQIMCKLSQSNCWQQTNFGEAWITPRFNTLDFGECVPGLQITWADAT